MTTTPALALTPPVPVADLLATLPVGLTVFPRDPDFAAKAGRVLDLYARTWQGRPLDKDEYVISADELCEASHNSSDVKSSVM